MTTVKKIPFFFLLEKGNGIIIFFFELEKNNLSQKFEYFSERRISEVLLLFGWLFPPGSSLKAEEAKERRAILDRVGLHSQPLSSLPANHLLLG